MSAVKKTVFGLSIIFVLLFLMDVLPFTRGIAEFLRLSPPIDACHLACALLGFLSMALGLNAGTVYLVSIGILLVVNGLTICITGISLVDLAMGTITVAPITNRLIIGLLYIVMGACAVGIGASAADILQDDTTVPPPA